MFDPIYTATDPKNESSIEVAPTAVESLSVSVTDHSSNLRQPVRVWGFLDVTQAAELRDALDLWLTAPDANGMTPDERKRHAETMARISDPNGPPIVMDWP